MPLKIVRNEITKREVDAIVNTTATSAELSKKLEFTKTTGDKSVVI